MSVFCPNPQCPFVTKFGRAAEYRDGFAACSDCGTALTSGASTVSAAAGGAVRTAWSRDAVVRLSLSAGVFVLVLAAGLLPLPGVSGLLEPEYGSGRAVPLLGVGLTPLLYMAGLVEAVLLLPFLRGVRLGGDSRRSNVVWVVMALGFGTALLQASQVARFLEAIGAVSGGSIMSGEELSSRGIMVLLMALFLALVAVAVLANRYGLGGGFALVFAAGAAAAVVAEASHLVQAVAAEVITPMGFLGALLIGGGVVALAVVGLRPPKHSSDGAAAVQGPVGSYMPALAASSVLALSGSLQSFGVDLAGELQRSPAVFAVAGLVLCVNFALLCTWAVGGPRRIARLYARWSKSPGVETEAAVTARLREHFPRAVVWSVALAAGPFVASFAASTLGLPFTIASWLVVLTAFVLDARDEAVARAQGSWTQVWTLARVHEADAALARLQEEDIPAFVRGRRMRALFHVFGPLFALEVHVRSADAERARSLFSDIAPRA